jgi:hypothetical protein
MILPQTAIDSARRSSYAPVMRVACSFCHTRFDVSDDETREQAEKKVGHLVCPTCVCPRCKSEIGIEPVTGPQKQAKLFGAVLATAAFLVVVVSGLVVMSA